MKCSFHPARSAKEALNTKVQVEYSILCSYVDNRDGLCTTVYSYINTGFPDDMFTLADTK